MLKILVKKQLTEVFKGYFYDSKKNKARSKLSTALWFVFFGIIMIVILGGIFTMLSLSLCGGLPQEMLWLYFVIMGLVSVLLGVFGSVFNSYAGLYCANDNDLLFSLPIHEKFIIASRLINVYVLGLMYSAVVFVPAMVVYQIVRGFSLSALLGSIIMLIEISALILVLSCLLGWVVAKISLKLKNKSIVSVLISLVCIGAYYFFYFKAQSIISNIAANSQMYGDKIKEYAYFLYTWGQCGCGDLISVLVSIVISVAVTVLAWRIVSRSFMKIATSSGAVKKAVYREKTVKARNASSALLFKELGRFTSSPTYMLNSGIGIILMPIAGVALLIKASAALPTLQEAFYSRPGMLTVLSAAIICMISSTNDMAAPAVSLESSNIRILQSLPITPWQVLRAKTLLQVVLTVPPAIVFGLLIVIALKLQAIESLLVLVMTLAFVLLASLIGTTFGILLTNLNWTSEVKPIKQSAAVTFSLFGGWIYSLILAILYYLFGFHLGGTIYLALAAAVTLVLSFILVLWLKKGGSRRFAEL